MASDDRDDTDARDIVTLADGAGGSEMQDLVRSLGFSFRGDWKYSDDDAAVVDVGGGKSIVFTTDSYVVSPVFFPGADIGHLAFSGTVNDLCMMGARPLGLSLGIVVEEGFSRADLVRIVGSIKKLSGEFGVPVVTGDTKVMERGKVDGIVINTSGVGIVDNGSVLAGGVCAGDKVIVSGGIAEHAVALLSARFDFECDVVSDSKPLVREMSAVSGMLKYAKDPTRGGIAGALNEISSRFSVRIRVDEESVPVKKAVRSACGMLGLDCYQLASEGRFLCVASDSVACDVVRRLREFDPDACVIGEVVPGDAMVVVRTGIGERALPVPSGRIVPRIC